MVTADFPVSEVAQNKEFVDLSCPIETGMPVYPGHQKTVVFDVKSHAETRRRYGEDALTTTTKGLLVSDHGPTHTDAISHFNPADDAESIDQMPLHMFYTRAICIDVPNITSSEDYLDEDGLRAALEKDNLTVKEGDTVLLHTGHWNRNWNTETWLTEYGGLTRGAAEWLADQGVVNIGADAPSIDSAAEMERRRNGKSDHYPAHRVCKERGLTNTENLARLDQVAGKQFTYAGFPLSIDEGTGSPIRAIAIVDTE